MGVKTVEKPVRKPGRKADYRGATPEQVAVAVLRYRPAAKQRPEKRARQDQRSPG